MRLFPNIRYVMSVALVALLSSGCANHVRYLDSEDELQERQVRAERWVLQSQGEVVQHSRLHLQIVQEADVELTVRKVSKRMEEATPYQGAREIWEVPAGIVSLPLSFAFNVVDFALLGFVPNSLVDGVINWSFSAMNPAMNTENENRVVAREIKVEEKGRRVSQEVERTPYAQQRVALRLDDGAPLELQTDARGNLEVDLLELDLSGSAGVPRRLHATVVGAVGKGRAAERSWFMDRPLAKRLHQAAAHLAVIEQDDPSAEELARAISGLEAIGFKQRSLAAEVGWLERWDRKRPDRAAQLRASVERLLGQNQAGVPAAPALAVH